MGMSRQQAMIIAYEIPGQLWPLEQGWIYDNFQFSKSHVDLGVYCGRSLFLAAAGMNSGHVIGVDSFVGHPFGRDWLESVCNLTADKTRKLTGKTTTIINKSSIEAARQFASVGRKFDSIWIDADHHYAECKQDIELWTPLINQGGIIAGHDYWPKDHGVMDAVNETGSFKVIPNTRIWTRLKQ